MKADARVQISENTRPTKFFTLAVTTMCFERHIKVLDQKDNISRGAHALATIQNDRKRSLLAPPITPTHPPHRYFYNGVVRQYEHRRVFARWRRRDVVTRTRRVELVPPTLDLTIHNEGGSDKKRRRADSRQPAHLRAQESQSTYIIFLPSQK